MRHRVFVVRYWFDRIFGSSVVVFLGLLIALVSMSISIYQLNAQVRFLNHTFCGVVAPYSSIAHQNPPPTANGQALLQGFDTANHNLHCAAPK